MPFQPQGIGLDILHTRYAKSAGESWQQGCLRVAQCSANAEYAEASAYRDIFYEMLVENLFMAGGRIWYGSGRPNGQLLNCFVVPTEDSRAGWGKSVADIIQVSGTGGGVGLNCSPIRPRGTPINGTGGEATGAVSLMEIINAVGEVIKAGGGRRTALMLCLAVNHGDIEEFLDKKLDIGALNNANISVVFNENPEPFFDLVRNDGELSLIFREREVQRISARTLWNRIVKNAKKSGEPGLLNGYLANKMSNTWYIAPLVSTNPCGEIWLSPYDCCCLGALVLPRFIKNTRIDYDLLKSTIQTSVRFLDDVLTVNHYPLPEIAETCKSLRRIGLGVMGLHDMLLMLGMNYTSAESLEFVDKLMKFIKNNAYQASIELAKERGPFPKFEPAKFLKSGFVKQLKPTLRREIEKYGIRNCALLTIAPTGTTSMVCGVTSGIEPMFAPAYERRWWHGNKLEKEIVVHPLFKEFYLAGKSVDHFQGTYDLELRDHFEMQRVCQRHVDNAISKTINIMPDVSEAELSDLFMEYFPDLKGVTVYPEGSRDNQPLSPLSIEDAIKHINNETGIAGATCRLGGECDT